MVFGISLPSIPIPNLNNLFNNLPIPNLGGATNGITGALGLNNIFSGVTDNIKSVIYIVVGVILFLLIGIPLLKWIFRSLFGSSKQPQYYPPPPPMYYPPPSYPPPSYPPMNYSGPPMNYSGPPMNYSGPNRY